MANMIGNSVDGQTDRQMQEIIRQEFVGHTILMIAHRLSSLLDFDKVIVMDAGRVIEVGKPAELLERVDSAFRRLYQGSLATEA